jgi:hypothetical protein
MLPKGPCERAVDAKEMSPTRKTERVQKSKLLRTASVLLITLTWRQTGTTVK